MFVVEANYLKKTIAKHVTNLSFSFCGGANDIKARIGN